MIPYWTSRQLQDLPEIGHAFFSRETGRKTDEWGLDLSSPVDDQETRNPHFDEVERHCRAPLAWTHQVHGTRVLEATTPGKVGDADALYTREPGLALLIRNADCLPLLMVDTRQHLIGAVHAGWRGLVRGVIPTFFHELRDLWDPLHTRVAIGPSLGPQSAQFLRFRDELPEWAWAFRCDPPHQPQTAWTASIQEERVSSPPLEGPRFDLWAIACHQLIEAGVPASSIEVLGIDTFRDPRFFSYRRRVGSEYGCNGSAIWLKPE
ncbi:MAG: polyphenol oxidase family protein [Chlamydiia bacterium]